MQIEKVSIINPTAKKIINSLLSLVLIISMSGCNITQTSVDTLLKPPTPSLEQQEIYTALLADVGANKNINLIYPKSGQHRSAYVIANFDDEPTDEAIVFYKLSNSATNTGSTIKVNVLDQIDGQWRSQWVMPETDASDVEKVSFVNDDDDNFIVIGFNFSGVSVNRREVKAYTYKEDKENQTGKMLKPVFSEKCETYETYDMDGDGVDELVTIVNSVDDTENKITSAKMYKCSGGSFYGTDSVPMETETTEYTAVYSGTISQKRPALLIDEVHANETRTEILSIENGVFRNVTYNTINNIYDATARLSGLACMDLDGDGEFEIPKEIPLPRYEENKLYLINWRHYIDGELAPFLTSYIDYTFGYRFTVPQNWVKQVAAKKDASNNEVTFYINHPEDPQNETQKLLKIKTFLLSSVFNSKTDGEIQMPEGYSLLSADGQLVYGFAVYDTGTDLDIAFDQVKNMFFHL